MIVDTLAVAPVVIDSLSQQIGAQVGTQVSALVALALGAAVKIAMDASKKVSVKLGDASPGVKALIAVVFSQAAVWGSSASGLAINPDINAMDATIAGLVVSGIAMGVNSGLKSVGVSVKSKRKPKQ